VVLGAEMYVVMVEWRRALMARMDELPLEIKQLVWRYGKLPMVLELHGRGEPAETIEVMLKAAAIEDYLEQMHDWGRE